MCNLFKNSIIKKKKKEEDSFYTAIFEARCPPTALKTYIKNKRMKTKKTPT